MKRRLLDRHCGCSPFGIRPKDENGDKVLMKHLALYLTELRIFRYGRIRTDDLAR
ncbi:MAG TPA: hypothetical protein VK892_12635 [Pyrinomonadaceae bacterium]|nr:hypothetical protein [Pyrinomonadaceae bacterium]